MLHSIVEHDVHGSGRGFGDFSMAEGDEDEDDEDEDEDDYDEEEGGDAFPAPQFNIPSPATGEHAMVNPSHQSGAIKLTTLSLHAGGKRRGGGVGSDAAPAGRRRSVHEDINLGQAARRSVPRVPSSYPRRRRKGSVAMENIDHRPRYPAR